MKIIIAGDPDSIWTKTYIENVLLNDRNEIYLLGNPNGQYDDFYKENHVKIIDHLYKNPQKRLAILYYKYVWTLRQITKIKDLDAFHVHYATLYRLRLLWLVKKKCKKSVVSYWGSDLFRADAAENVKKGKYLAGADCITVCTVHMKDVFNNIYDGLYLGKINVLDFGINTYRSIDEYERKSGIERRYDYDQMPEVTMMVGYNGKEEQQHIEVLKQLALLPVELQKKIKVIIPLMYGLEKQSYFDELRKTAEAGSYQYSFLMNYMSPEEMAELYAETDIMIHAQTTDALSGTVQELLYAGVLVLNPKWLTYHEMEERNVYYLVYSDFNEMRDKLKTVLESGCSQEDIQRIKRNKQLLKDYSGWEALVPKWKRLYEVKQ